MTVIPESKTNHPISCRDIDHLAGVSESGSGMDDGGSTEEEKTADWISPDGDKECVGCGTGNRSQMMVHSQVLRIREEDMRIGVGIGEGLSDTDRCHKISAFVHLRRQVHTMLCSRPSVMPSSPLGNRASITASFVS